MGTKELLLWIHTRHFNCWSPKQRWTKDVILQARVSVPTLYIICSLDGFTSRSERRHRKSSQILMRASIKRSDIIQNDRSSRQPHKPFRFTRAGALLELQIELPNTLSLSPLFHNESSGSLQALVLSELGVLPSTAIGSDKRDIRPQFKNLGEDAYPPFLFR